MLRFRIEKSRKAFHKKTHRKREYMCRLHYREIPVERACFFQKAERDVQGADGRWLWRGIAEGWRLPGTQGAEAVGSDRTACYSGRVWKYLMRLFAVRQKRTEVVTRVNTRLLNMQILGRRFFMS